MERKRKRERIINYLTGIVGVSLLVLDRFTDWPVMDNLALAGAGAISAAIILHFFLFRTPKGDLSLEDKLRLEQGQTSSYTVGFWTLAALSLCLFITASLPKEHPAAIIFIGGSVVFFVIFGVTSIPELRVMALMRKDSSLYDERQQSLYDKAYRKGFDWMLLSALFFGAGNVLLEVTLPLWFAFYFPPVIGAAGVQWYLMRNA